ncbi:hypothetical protein ANN_10395 [Periplaneta americana]|uniref:Uncharacterized protein n=1 Tax=Periplaneta americana TaxID=6978 RepID=A0ABQ8TP90_PERAM|nr:hypothetical protein ANN_10395 [Periplaneta americana]
MRAGSSPHGEEIFSSNFGQCMDRCPPSIVMHLGSYDRWRNPVTQTSYNGWGLIVLTTRYLHSGWMIVTSASACGREANSRLCTRDSTAYPLHISASADDNCSTATLSKRCSLKASTQLREESRRNNSRAQSRGGIVPVEEWGALVNCSEFFNILLSL